MVVLGVVGELGMGRGFFFFFFFFSAGGGMSERAAVQRAKEGFSSAFFVRPNDVALTSSAACPRASSARLSSSM
jgi:hypothetical protein